MKGSNPLPRELMDSLMLSIVSFMNQAGMPIPEIESSFREGIGGLAIQQGRRSRGGRRRTSEIGCDTIAGAVLRAWHRDPEYLDEIANPVSLPMSGKSLSLTRLVNSQDEHADVPHLIQAMLRTRLIKRTSKALYVPTTSAATISQMHPFAVDHVVKTVLRLVETVSRNMQLSQAEHSLVERYAHVPDLDAKEAKAFSEFSRQQGAACLEAIEDWLEARRKRTSSRRAGANGRLSAGMHVFAYLGQTYSQAQQREARSRKKATSSRATRA